VVKVGGDAVGARGQAVTLLQLFWREEASDWGIFINIFRSILIFAHNSFLPLLFDFLLPGLLLLYGFIIVIVIFKCGKLILRYGIEVQVNVNALFVEEDLAKVKLISLVSAVPPGAPEEEATKEAKGCVDCPGAPEVDHLHRLLQTQLTGGRVGSHCEGGIVGDGLTLNSVLFDTDGCEMQGLASDQLGVDHDGL
jgi:hypothetical protein